MADDDGPLSSWGDPVEQGLDLGVEQADLVVKVQDPVAEGFDRDAVAGDRARKASASGVSSEGADQPASEPGAAAVIDGTGLAFVKPVYFGSNRAARVHVLSARELTAVAPAGHGTVSVRVVTAGGKQPSYPLYTY